MQMSMPALNLIWMKTAMRTLLKHSMNRPPWRTCFWEKYLGGIEQRMEPTKQATLMMCTATMIGISKAPLSLISVNMVVEKMTIPVIPVN